MMWAVFNQRPHWRKPIEGIGDVDQIQGLTQRVTTRNADLFVRVCAVEPQWPPDNVATACPAQ